MRLNAPGLLLLALAAACTGDHAPSLMVAPPPPPPPVRVGYYAAPNGTGAGDGSAARPWDFATAIAGGHGTVRPGDTIWVRAGRYLGAFESTVAGAPGRPVVIRAYPGERAIIDAAGSTAETLRISGTWTVLWGLELTNTALGRTTFRPDVVVNNASNTAYVNLVIHDGGEAFFTFPDDANVEFYGSIIYNNGWDTPVRSDGHGAYLKSDGGPVVVRHNVMFNQFGYGIHAYSDYGQGLVQGITLADNVLFNNGILSASHRNANLLVGGQEPADDVTVTGNLAYDSPAANEWNVQIGYSATANGSIALTGNQFLGGEPVLNVGFWRQVTARGNRLAGAGNVVTLRDTVPPLGWDWGSNEYDRDPLAAAWHFDGLDLPLLPWQVATALGSTDLANTSTPAQPAVRVLPNRYEPGRGIIAVVNGPRQGAVSVDLDSVLAPGDSFVVHNVQDLFGTPVLTGVYGGPVSLPMGGVTPPVPTGLSASRAPRTAPDFDVFLVRRLRAAAP